MSDITKMDLEQHDQLARNIASELAIGDNAQVLTIIKTGLALAYKNGQEGAPATPAATPMASGETSDGYHTFNELYEHRHALFSAVCAAWGGWKSTQHDDGSMFDGWFIAGVMTPKGMATYHLPLSWWSRFHCRALGRAPKWDGHTAQQVPERIASLAMPGLTVAVAMNESTPQKLQEAAQPQRESEQPEQALREAVRDMMPLIELYAEREINSPANHQEFARQTERQLGRLRAALSPQTDSQEPR